MLTRVSSPICRLTRLYHKDVPRVRIASKRHSLPQIRQTSQSDALQLDHDPSKRFEPYPYAVTEDNKVEVVKRLLTPLHDVPYKEQLSSKESNCRNELRNFAQELYQSGTPIRVDVRRLPCEVNKMVPSPQTHHYRTSDELSIWYGLDGKTLTVGYNVFPISKHGSTISVEPNGCDVMKAETIKLVDILQEFIRQQTKVGVCFSLGTDGGWRVFKINSNSNNELMLAGIMNPRTLRVKELIEERNHFRDFMIKRCEQEDLKLKSLYFQPCPNSYCRHEDVPFELLHGEKQIVENIGDLKFLISPDTYVHHGTIGAKILVDTVRKTFQDFSFKEKPIIIDARSGTGLISLMLSDLALQIVGVENRAWAVDTARLNAELSGVKNCDFINSDLEIVLDRIIEKYANDRRQEIVVTIDVPPGGVHRSVIEVLRHCKLINKLIITAPKISAPRVHKTLMKLCQKGGVGSLPPFMPIQATPVDVCPMTESYHVVIAFERIQR